jgi:hypothetical protein
VGRVQPELIAYLDDRFTTFGRELRGEMLTQGDVLRSEMRAEIRLRPMSSELR